MLIALMTILFLGGGGGSSAVMAYFAESQDRVKEVVIDNVRSDEAVDILKSMQGLGKQQNEAWQDVFKELENEFGEHESDEDAIDAIWDDYYRQLREINDEAVELRFELREQLTREEWEQVFN